ncbi:MAG: hypothetical protein JW731_11920 [Bacteroidales bacterium]|nr:hypothetical protein [Bacteroidales bacterium]
MKKSNYFFPVMACLFFAITINGQPSKTMVFKKVQEPREKAFSLLLPNNWVIEGGIFRIDPTAGGGSGNAIDAKLDIQFKKDQNGTVMMRWFPDMNYFDMSNSPAGQMGMFPTGSNYNGMTVIPKMDALSFIQYVVIPYAHPGLMNFEVVDNKSSPEIVEGIKKADAFIGIPFVYTAGIATISYTENGIKYKERIIAATQDFGELGAGLWKNRFTLCARAPYDQFESWEPVFIEMIRSVQINMQWLIGEIRGQVERGAINADVLRRLQEMDKEIQEGHSKTYAEINNDMFLTLTEQEEYVNPYSNEVEVGSNQWKNRWVNESGEVVYSDSDDYNPNLDQILNRSDFKKTPIRKRYGD